MNRYVTVTEKLWLSAGGKDRRGALMTTRNGRTLFVDRSELRALADDLHDMADYYDGFPTGSER